MPDDATRPPRPTPARPLPAFLRRHGTLAIVVLAVLALVWLATAGSRRKTSRSEVAVQTVGRRDISLTIEATGTVEPIDLVEVKSKASGQIVRMPVQVGTSVKRGELLAQIDTRDVENQYSQALAALRAAQANAAVARAQMKRADELFAQQVITASEHESATLAQANAQAQLVKARTDLDLAGQRRDDATVRAPIEGTILEQLVSSGQVISSATSSASGGTSLLKMADLGRIRMRVLVSETDIGNVRAGQVATVTVDAFPQRPFRGLVEKIEPQAVVQQSVTMFPVLVSISNEQRLLLPGMNGEVSMLIERRDGVVAVPVDAVRTVRELPAVASALGLDPKKVQADVQRQLEARAKEVAATGDTAARAGGRRAGFGADSSGRRRGALAGGAADSSRRGGRGSGRWRAAGGGATAGAGLASGASGSGGAARRAQVVFVQTKDGLTPRVVTLGLSDFDWAQVIAGVREGEQVALLSVVEAQAERTQNQSRIRQRMGSGVPGAPGGGGAGGGGGRGGGGR